MPTEWLLGRLVTLSWFQSLLRPLNLYLCNTFFLSAVAFDIILLQRIVELIWSIYMFGWLETHNWLATQEHDWKFTTDKGKNSCFGSKVVLVAYIVKLVASQCQRNFLICMIFNYCIIIPISYNDLYTVLFFFFFFFFLVCNELGLSCFPNFLCFGIYCCYYHFSFSQNLEVCIRQVLLYMYCIMCTPPFDICSIRWKGICLLVIPVFAFVCFPLKISSKHHCEL